MARFIKVVDFIVPYLETLKTRLVKPYNLRLHPQPFHAFRWQVYYCSNAGFDTANNLFAWAAAPVIACIKASRTAAMLSTLSKARMR